jgi:hypothetical protein
MASAPKSLGAGVQYTEIRGVGHLDGIAAAYDTPELMPWMLAHKGSQGQ